MPATGAFVHVEGHAYQYQSPFPPPEILERYEQIAPGTVERIFALVEQQTKHRQELERIVVVGDNRRAWAGIVCAFVFGMAFLVAGVFLALHGQPVIGGIFGPGGLAAIVGAFVYGTKTRTDERRERAQLMVGPPPEDRQ